MRRWLILTLILTVLLTASGCDAQENGESTETSGVSAEAVDETELGELLTSIAERYEISYNGMPNAIYWRNDPYFLARDLLMDMGAINETEALSNADREKIRLLTEALTGTKYEIDESFDLSNLGAMNPEAALTVEQKSLEIIGTTARLTVARSYEGVELLDAVYIFEQADPPVGWEGTVVEDFVLDGKVWHLIGVELAERPSFADTITEISTPEELIQWMKDVNARVPEAAGGTVKLTADLDMTGYEMEPVGMPFPFEDREYASIEERAEQALLDRGFSGVFVGNGHIISGVSIESSLDEAGFFGILSPSAIVRDLHIEGTVIQHPDDETMDHAVGGFAGRIINGAEVTNCSFSGTVRGSSNVGGFAGSLDRSTASSDLPPTRITGCSADADITATWYGGGFAGSANLPIADCSADGTLTIAIRPNASIPSNIGGFSGDMLFTITGCHSGVEIFYEVPGANRMGSFVGEAAGFGPETVAITDCTIDADAVHEGWYLVGYKVYSTMPVDIDVIEE